MEVKIMTRAEAILKAREMIDAGEFMRPVIKSTPCDLLWNSVELACGHSTAWAPKANGVLPERIECNSCAKEWISSNSKEEK
jgi:hypothetical protein